MESAKRFRDERGSAAPTTAPVHCGFCEAGDTGATGDRLQTPL